MAEVAGLRIEMPRCVEFGRWAAPLSVGGLGVIFAVDSFVDLKHDRFLVRAVCDWSSHAATTWILLASTRTSFDPTLLAATIAGSWALDLDHIPIFLDWKALTPANGRPYTHALVSPLAVGLASLALPRRARAVVGRIALGMVSHLVRDLPTGGVYPFWPLTDWECQEPYGVYAALLLACAASTVIRSTRLTATSSVATG